MRNISEKLQRISNHTFLFSNFSESHAIYETMWKTDRPQITIYYNAHTLHAG